MNLFLDVAIPMDATTTAIGAVLAVVFFLIFSGIAIFAYKMLKKTVKTAVRMVIVVLILLIAVAGSFALYFGIQPSSATQKRSAPPKSSR